MGNNLNICGVCEQKKENGFYLYQLYICEECEKKIVATNPGDENYSFFVEKLKGINHSSYTI